MIVFNSKTVLHRTLNLREIVFISMGTMIGAGIFILPGIIAQQLGPASILAFLIAGIISLVTGLSAAEMATGMPKTGGSYYFLSRAFGPFVGSIVGWGSWLSLFLKGSFALVGFGDYLKLLFPLSPVIAAVVTGIILILINIYGTKIAGKTQFVIVLFLLAILTLFIFLGVTHIDSANLQPLFTKGISPLLPGIGLVYVSYIGLVKITSVSEEIIDPHRNLPRGIIVSTCAVILLYTLIMLIIIGSGVRGAPETLVVHVAENIWGKAGSWLIIVAGFLATLSTANAAILASSRYPLAMAKDKLMPRWFLYIDPKRMTPLNSLFLTGGLMLLFVILLDVEKIVKLAGVFNALIFCLINAGVIIMRTALPNWYTPTFKVPFFPWLPLFGLISNAIIIFYLGWYSVLATLVVIIVCSIVYRFLSPKSPLFPAQWRSAVQRTMFEGAVRTNKPVVSQSLDDFLVFLAHPRHAPALVKLAASCADPEKTRVTLTNLIKVPYQTPLDLARKSHAVTWQMRKNLIAEASKLLSRFGLKSKEQLAFTHDIPRGMMDMANEGDWDLVILGWDETSGKIEDFTHPIHKVIHHTGKNVLVLWERGLNQVKNILIPVDWGPFIGLEVALAERLARNYQASVTFCKVVPEHIGQEHLAATEAYLQKISRTCCVDSQCHIIHYNDEAKTIVDLSNATDLIILGASQKWSLPAMFMGTKVDRIAAEAKCSVILTRPAGAAILPIGGQSKEALCSEG